MSHEDLPYWEFYSTSSTLESAVFPLLASTQSNVLAPESLPQFENHSDIFNALDLHSLPQEQSIPVPKPVTDDLQPRNKKRKMCTYFGDPIAFHEEAKRADGYSQSSKLRSTEMRSAFERRRRNRIADRMRTLQELLHNATNKLGAASVLDKSIEYIRTLQNQIQNMCYSGNIVRYASHHVPVHGIKVPQIFPIRSTGNEFMVGVSNIPCSTNMGFSCSMHDQRPLQSIQISLTPAAVYASSEFTPCQHQIFNPCQQQMAAAGFGVQPVSFPMPMNFPTETEPAFQDYLGVASEITMENKRDSYDSFRQSASKSLSNIVRDFGRTYVPQVNESLNF